jgi:hypothetical protein
MVKCPICLTNRRKLDKHHIYPVGYGGPFDGPLFSLCAGCHQDVHRQAEAIAAGKLQYLMPEENAVRANMPENGRLITSIITAKRNYERGIVPSGGSLKNHEVVFSLTKRQLELLHKVKLIVGAPSLQSLMEGLVMAFIKKVIGHTPDGLESTDAPGRRKGAGLAPKPPSIPQKP